MNDVGNHGGSSAGETSAALVFMSPKFNIQGNIVNISSPIAPTGEFEYHDKIQQSDLVPTLASLLGFPIPKNNLGLFIGNFLKLWPGVYTIYQLYMAGANCVQTRIKWQCSRRMHNNL